MWLQYILRLGDTMLLLLPFWLLNALVLSKSRYLVIGTKKTVIIAYAILQTLLVLTFAYFTYYEIVHSSKLMGNYNYDIMCKYSDFASRCLFVSVLLNIILPIISFILTYRHKRQRKEIKTPGAEDHIESSSRPGHR